MKKKIRRIGVILFLLVLIVIGAFTVYVMNYYKAKNYDMSQLNLSNSVKVEQNGNYTVIGTEEAKTGYIFYPGAKVDERAYIPLLATIAQKNNIRCILVKMPFHLAVFDINAADTVIKHYPNIKEWYIGGHSLGGAMAASYAADHTAKIKGLILMGAYPTKLLPDQFPVLALYGSNDHVLNKERLFENAKYANTYTSYEIKGGNHAWFGYYGQQKKDGKATITHEKQWEITASEIEKYFNRL